jgi:hypothetical protein
MEKTYTTHTFPAQALGALAAIPFTCRTWCMDAVTGNPTALDGRHAV